MATRHGVPLWSAAIVLFLATTPDAFGDCLEPRAAFVLNKSGWVEFVLRQEGRPVANATIQISDDRGAIIANGETGDEGETAFPLPRGAFCVVEVKIGNRLADPIRLYKLENSVEPARVLLSYGLRPCCRFKDRNDEPTVEAVDVTPQPVTEPFPAWRYPAAVATALLIAALIFFGFKRSFTSESGSASRK